MRATEASDDELLRVALEGGSDRDAAFLELVNRYERRVYGISYRFFGNHSDAQDATQDTFLAIIRRGGSFRGDSALSTWIYRVAINACKDLARARSRRPQTPVEDVARTAEAAGEPLAADDEVAGFEMAHEIQQALDQLDDTSRALIILCSIEGRDYREVAEITDLPIGTVKSRVFRARAKLAEILAPVLTDDGSAPATSPDRPSPATGTARPSSPTRGPPDH